MTRKETTNVFTEGMVSDINPLVTPNNVLTNALNATLITMNGNENVLQNDMGNAKVDTAFLPSGYVPVGMKEHGGIIYVASHNPITKKSQIGSFPSPQQLFNGEDLNVKNINIDFNNFIEEKGGIPYINAEYYKEKLFVDKITGTARKFHPGDKFILTVDSIDQEIIQAVKDGVINFRLGIMTSSGDIDYVDESKLRIYPEDKGFWIFCYTQGKTVEELLKNKEVIQIYNAKTSGELLLIVEYKTIQAFNLIRQYSFSEDSIQVKFFGKFDSYIESLNGYTNINENIGLLEDNTFEVKDEIVLEGKSDKKNYAISPVSVYGVLDRLKKTGTIDFSLIKPNQESSTEWRYYVTDSYLKIGWSYDYYNIDPSQYVSKIQFTFIDFQKSDLPLEELTGYTVNITKDYYNGSFEEVFLFGSSGIMKNYIYIVRIDRYIINSSGEEVKQENPFYRLLYTGTLFNDQYSLQTNFNNLSPKEEILPFTLDIKTDVKTPIAYQYSQKIGTSPSYVDTTVLNPNNFKLQVESEQVDVSNYRFGIKKGGTYNIKSTVNAQFNYTNKYAGFPKDQELQQHVRDNIKASTGDFDDSDLDYNNPQSLLVNELTIENSKGEPQFEETSGNVGQFSIQVSTNRNILANAGSIKNESYEIRTPMPLYREDMSISDKNSLIGFTNVSGGVRCLLGTEDDIRYNGTLKDNGEIIDGTSAGGGDDSGLSTCNINMGNPVVNILAGCDGQDASLRIIGSTRKSPSSLNNWPYAEESDEVDRSDNFLLATWKTTKGNVRLINLGSRRTETKSIGSTSIIRADLMLKCYLSQMMIVSTNTISGYTVRANSSNYVFHKAFNTKMKISFNMNNSNTPIDFYLQNDTKSIKTRMSEWKAKIPELNDYLPIFSISNSEPTVQEVEFGEDINFVTDTDVMNCYLLGNSSSERISVEYDENKIYLGVPTGIANSDGIMPLQKDDNGLYTISSSFTSIKDWYNRSQSLPHNINEMFKISDSGGGKKEVLAEELDIAVSKWVKGKDSNAPDMLRGIYFGSTKLFDY